MKEKQQEIDFLRKERDLERERVTKAASQADQAEQTALSIKQEYEKYREEMQHTVNEAETAVAKLLTEKSALVVQLEEEKRKCEDLLFRFEEESVNKDDIQVINTVNESRIRELEKELSEERERVVQLERDSVKLFEAEEELARLRNEISSATSSQNSQLQDLESRNQSLEEIKGSLEKEVQEKSSLMNECVGRISELEHVLSVTQLESTTHKQSEIRLEKELETAKQSLQDKETFIANMREEFERQTNSLNEQLQKSKETIETNERKNTNEKDLLLLEYRRRIEERDRVMKVKTEELKDESRRLLEQQNALEGLKAENVERIRELSESFKQQLHEKDSKIEKVSLQLNQKESEAERLLNELSAQSELCKKKDEELINALQKLEELSAKLKLAEENNNVLSKQIQDYKFKSDDNIKIIQEKQKLEQDLASLIASEEKSTAQLNKLSEELKVKDKELAELRSATIAQIEEITKHFESQINDKAKYIDEINADVAQKALMLVKLEKDIVDLKAIIASKDEEIKHLFEKTSELQYALTLSEQTKTNLESELRVFELNVQSLNEQIARAEEKISQLSSQKEKLESDIASMISSSADSSEQLAKYNEDLRKKEKELDEAREEVFQTKKTLKLTEGKLSNIELDLKKNTALVEQLHSEKANLELQMGDTKKSNMDYAEKIREYEQKESELLARVSDSERIKENLVEKSHDVDNLSERLVKREQEIVDLRGQCEILRNSHEEETSSLRKDISDLSAELSISRDEIKNLQKSKSKLEADQSANRWSIEELTEKLNVQLNKTSKLENLIREKDLKLEDMEHKLSELHVINDSLTADKEMSDKNLTASLNSMTNTIEELRTKLKNAEDIIKDKTIEILKAIERAEKSDAQVAISNDIISSIQEEHIRISDELKYARKMSTRKNKNEGLFTCKDKYGYMSEYMDMEKLQMNNEISRKNVRLKEMKAEILEMVKFEYGLKLEINTRQNEIEEANKQNEELKEKLRLSRETADKQAIDLNNKEASIIELRTQMEAMEDVHVEHAKAEQQSRNEEIKQKQSDLSSANKRLHELQHTVNALEKKLREQETKSANLVKTIECDEQEVDKNVQNLQEKLNIAKVEETRLLDELNRLEKENKQVTTKWIEATNQLKLSHENMKNNYDASADIKQHIVTNDMDITKLQEENDTAKSQIDFLNSVIVDMQRKNETLLCKIEVLEMGIPANEAEDYTRSTLDKRMVAPRMFCDICDQFDLHETEDCPRQAQDFSENIEKAPKSSKKQQMERPYCENCEMFGHDTHDCDDTETF